MGLVDRLTWEQQGGRRRATFGDAGLGYTVPIVPKTDYTLLGAASSTQILVLAQGIDSSAWVSGALVVRFHGQPVALSATANVFIDVDNISLVAEEPQTVFVAATAVASTAAITSATPAGTLLLASFTPPIGPMLRVKLRLTQGGTATTATIQLSVDLIGRPA